MCAHKNYLLQTTDTLSELDAGIKLSYWLHREKKVKMKIRCELGSQEQI